MSTTFAISHDAPHATVPTVLVQVWLSDEHRGGVAPAYVPKLLWGESKPKYDLWVPSLDTWTLDTVRMALHELSAYVPFDSEALCGVDARQRKRRGRPSNNYSRASLDADVRFWVSSRGWRATISTDRNHAPETKYIDGIPTSVVAGFPTGEWSDPMVAALLDLAAGSPFRLATVTKVLPGDPSALRLRYTPRLMEQMRSRSVRHGNHRGGAR